MRRYLIRLIIFIGLYLLIIFGQPPLIQALHGPDVTSNDPYSVFLIPLLLILFTGIYWHKIGPFSDYPQNWRRTRWFSLIALALIFTPINFFAESSIFPFITSPYSRIIWTYYVVLHAIVILFFLAIFPRQFIRRFAWLVILMPFISGIFFLLQLSELWKLLVTPTLLLLAAILPRLFPTAIINLDTAQVRLNEFEVGIGATCTGILSLAMFTTLFGFAVVALYQWYKLKKLPTFFAFLSGLAVVFIFNFIRVITLLMIGAFWSADLALKLFHEFFSAAVISVLFILYLYKVFPKLLVQKFIGITVPSVKK